MAIFYNKKEITSVNYGSKAIATIYKGATLIWQAIRSCFGKDFWINDKPWNNEDGWKNNL